MTDDRMNDLNPGEPLDDEPLPEALLDAARAYNAPPAKTPREAMWERIAAARAAARAGEGPRLNGAGAPAAPSGPPTPHVVPMHARRVRRPAWAMPLAAALLLAVGIGVGRYSARHDGDAGHTGGAPVAVGASADTQRTLAAATESTSAGATSPAQATRGGGAAPTAVPALPRGSERGGEYAQRPVPPASGGDGSDAATASASTPALAYRLAAAEHLAMTEALLTTVSADARAGRADSSVATWARDLLGTTRILLDSPAAKDPQLARLLRDLELVLAQVAQLPASRDAAAAEELREIDRAVQRHDVLTRVRAAAPPQSGT